MTLVITSPAFDNQDQIPEMYTCDGDNISPPLEIEDVPEDSESLVLIVEDPDAPDKIFSHWVVFNLPPEDTSLPESMPPERELTNGAMQGINGFGDVGYGGPCPPSGSHRYVFRLFALDTMLKLDASATRKDVLEAIDGHVIEEVQLLGTYGR